MSNFEFYPGPAQPSRGIVRWLLLFLHAALFGLMVYFYPDFEEMGVPLLTGNTARLVIPVWGGVVVFHLIATGLWDMIDGKIVARRERQRREEYRRITKRQKLMRQFTKEEPRTPPESE